MNFYVISKPGARKFRRTDELPEGMNMRPSGTKQGPKRGLGASRGDQNDALECQGQTTRPNWRIRGSTRRPCSHRWGDQRPPRRPFESPGWPKRVQHGGQMNAESELKSCPKVCRVCECYLVSFCARKVIKNWTAFELNA